MKKTEKLKSISNEEVADKYLINETETKGAWIPVHSIGSQLVRYSEFKVEEESEFPTVKLNNKGE